MDKGIEQHAGGAASSGGELEPPDGAAAADALDRWHELLSNRYVCEACLTRYFMKYRKCKACGAIGRIRLLTASLFDLADDDQELRDMIARGQRLVMQERGEGTAAAEPPLLTDDKGSKEAKL